MKIFFSLYAAALPFLLILDGLWLTFSKGFYRSQIGHLMTDSVRYIPVLLFYPLYVLGIIYFVCVPLALSGASLARVWVSGAFFGLIAYSTYDLVNHATLRGWPLSVTLVDIFWGTIVTGFTACFAVWIFRAL